MKLEESIKVTKLFDIYGGLLADSQAKLLKDFLFNDLGLTEIGKIYGISKQAVDDAVRKGRVKLYKFESKLHLYERLTQIEEIRDALPDDDPSKPVVEKIVDLFKGD